MSAKRKFFLFRIKNKKKLLEMRIQRISSFTNPSRTIKQTNNITISLKASSSSSPFREYILFSRSDFLGFIRTKCLIKVRDLWLLLNYFDSRWIQEVRNRSFIEFFNYNIQVLSRKDKEFRTYIIESIFSNIF